MTRNQHRATWIFVLIGIAGLALSLQAEFFSIRAGVSEDHLLDLTVGWSYLATGLITWWYRPANRIGPLMLAFAFTWFIGNLSSSGTPVLFSLGTAFEGVNSIFLVWLILSYPTGMLTTALERVGVVAATVGTLGAGVVIATTFDPRRFGCRTCSRAGLALFPSMRAWHAATIIGDRGAPAVALAVLIALALRWRRATAIERADLTPLWVVSIILIFVFTLEGIVASPGPRDPFASFLFELQKVGQLLIPIVFAWGLLRKRMARAAVGDLVVELDAPVSVGGMREALARALHDPTLRIALPSASVDAADGWVDEEGRDLKLPPDAAAVTVIHRDGERLAALVHDPALIEHRELLRAAAAAAGMAIANSHLQAEVRTQLEEVRASRARIVQAGDAERRKVERDLHDGAQQRLLSLSLALHAARRQAEGEADHAVIGDTLGLASEELGLAITELRELARGIHPTILTDEGLGPALESLTARASVPVTLVGAPTDRLPPAIEAAAYFVVSEALANVTKYANAKRASVRVSRSDGYITVEVRDDGVGGADETRGSGIRGLHDRVAAVNGRLTIVSPAGAGTTILAVLPCEQKGRAQ